jgi:hypothetical protein
MIFMVMGMVYDWVHHMNHFPEPFLKSVGQLGAQVTGTTFGAEKLRHALRWDAARAALEGSAYQVHSSSQGVSFSAPES